MPDNWWDPPPAAAATEPPSLWQRMKDTYLDAAQALPEAIGKTWNWANTPLVPQIDRAAQTVSEWLTRHTASETPLGSQARAWLGGGIEGVGHVLRGMTSPLGVALAAAPEASAAARGLASPLEAAVSEARPAVSTAADTLLPFLNGERQFSTIAPARAAWNRDAEALRQEYALVNDAPSEPIRDANQIAGDNFFRDTTRPTTPSFGGTDALDRLLTSEPTLESSATGRNYTLARERPAEPAVDAAAAEPNVPELAPHVTNADTADVEGSTGGLSEAPAGPASRVQALYDQLKPQWAESRAATADVPFDVPDEPFPDFFQRVVTDDPRQLMSQERSVRQAIDTTYPSAGSDTSAAAPKLPGLAEFLSGEEGAFTPQQAAQAATALRDQGIEGLTRYRTGAMLGPTSVVKKVLGDVGAVGTTAAREALGGNTAGAADLVRELFSPQTARTAWRELQNPTLSASQTPTAWGSTRGVIGSGGRMMNAATQATKDALSRAGFGGEADRILSIGTPQSTTGANTDAWLRKTPLARFPIPFSRIATNLAERAIEHTPGVGAAADWLTTGRLPSSLPKQALGAGALAGSYLYGNDVPDEVRPYVVAGLGPLGPLFAAGTAAAAAKHGNGTPYQKLAAAGNSFLSDLPIPQGADRMDPREWLATLLVPGAVSQVGQWATGVKPSTLDTRGEVLGPTIARLPFLNTALLAKKHGKAGVSAEPWWTPTPAPVDQATPPDAWWR